MKHTNKMIALLLITTSLILSGCLGGDEKKEVITIGAVVPLTGQFSSYGQALKKGFDAYTLLNKNIKVKYFDTKSSAKDAVSAIKKLSSEGIKFALGDATSGNTLAMAPIANREKILLFTPIATSDRLRDAGDYLFRNAPTNEKQAIKASSFLVKNSKVIASIYKNSAYSQNLALVFKQITKKTNPNITVCEVSYNETNNFRIVIEKLIQCKADSVFFPNNYEDVGRFLKQLAEKNIHIPVIGTDGAYSPKLIEIAKGSAEGFNLTMMLVDKKTSMFQKFNNAYLKKYNTDADVFSAYGYEAISIISQAIKISKNKQAFEVKDILFTTKFDTMSGKLSFDNTGELDRSYGLMVIKDGKFQ